MSEHLMSEAEIARAATTHMGKPAWYTVGLTVGSIGLYAAFFVFATQGPIQLMVAFVLSCYLVYAIYTPLHEAVHKNISGKKAELLWLNHALGYLSASLLGVSYTMHKTAHLTHHRNTNIEGQDPDFVTRGSGLGDVLSCGSKIILSEYQDYFGRVFPRRQRLSKQRCLPRLSCLLAGELRCALRASPLR